MAVGPGHGRSVHGATAPGLVIQGQGDLGQTLLLAPATRRRRRPSPSPHATPELTSPAFDMRIVYSEARRPGGPRPARSPRPSRRPRRDRGLASAVASPASGGARGRDTRNAHR